MRSKELKLGIAEEDLIFGDLHFLKPWPEGAL